MGPYVFWREVSIGESLNGLLWPYWSRYGFAICSRVTFGRREIVLYSGRQSMRLRRRTRPYYHKPIPRQDEFIIPRKEVRLDQMCCLDRCC